MKTILLVAFLLVKTYDLYSQDQHVIDSVTALIKNDGSRSDMEIFYELGFQYINESRALSIEYLDKGNQIAYGLRDSLMVVKFGRMKGQVFRRDGQLDEAASLLEKILPVAIRLNFSREVGFILRSLALIHTDMGHFDKGLEYNFRALELWNDENDQAAVTSVLNNIGLVHYKVGNYDKAIQYFNKSLLIAEARGFNKSAQLDYANMGMANILKQDFAEAKRCLKKIMDACDTSCSQEVRVVAEYGLGAVALHLKDLAAAKVHFERSYSNALQVKDPRFEAENLVKLAEINVREGNHGVAGRQLDNCLVICKRGDYRNVLGDAYMQFFEYHKALGNSKTAYEFLEKHVNLRDSILSAEVTNKIMIAQAEFDEKENRQRIAYNEELIIKQRTQTKLTVIICLLLLCMVVGLFVVIRSKQRMNRMLDERVSERTRELESNKAALERAYHEQNELISKTYQSVRSALATQEGLNATFQASQNVSEVELATAKNVVRQLRSLDQELARTKREGGERNQSTQV